MADVQRPYAPGRRTALAAWLTSVVAPALLGWTFWAATAAAPALPTATVPQPPQQVAASIAPPVAEPIGLPHR